jgi:hypothetical protein
MDQQYTTVVSSHLAADAQLANFSLRCARTTGYPPAADCATRRSSIDVRVAHGEHSRCSAQIAGHIWAGRYGVLSAGSDPDEGRTH